MDRDEEYSTDGSFGFNFESAIMHEIGHSLGLMHSNVYNAVMNPDYAMSAKGTNIQLTYDDIEGIQELYGELMRSSILQLFFFYNIRKTNENFCILLLFSFLPLRTILDLFSVSC